MKRTNPWATARRLALIFLCLGMLGALLGCAQNAPAETTAPTAALPRLNLSYVKAEPDEDSYQRYTSEDLNGNYDGVLILDGFQELTMDLDGESVAPADAIREGQLSAEELIAYGQIDARNGFCQEIPSTENGLTVFRYSYPNFVMDVFNDVYQTPDGNEHLIRQIRLSPVHDPLQLSFWHPLDDPLTPIDKEDWGVNFEIADASPVGITVKCSQTGGQQRGELFVWYYALFNDSSLFDTFEITQPLKMEDTTEFFIDWYDHLGPLPKGNYGIRFYVEDIYNEEDIPPLSQNFYDGQNYTIEFTIE